MGFIGLYSSGEEKDLFLSIAIFDIRQRRVGKGAEALDLLLSALRKRPIEKVQAEVVKSNMPSYFFFKKAGFEICGEDDDKWLFRRQLRDS